MFELWVGHRNEKKYQGRPVGSHSTDRGSLGPSVNGFVLAEILESGADTEQQDWKHHDVQHPFNMSIFFLIRKTTPLIQRSGAPGDKLELRKIQKSNLSGQGAL